MTGQITALSWNVQGEIGPGTERVQRQLDFLDDHASDVDLFLLQAVNSEAGSVDGWRGQLGAFVEYFDDHGFEAVHTGDWSQELSASTVQPHADIEGAHNRCNLTASRWPIERRALTLRNHGGGNPQNLNFYYSHFPEKILVGEVDVSDVSEVPTDELETWNVGIINGGNWGEEKLNMLETVYGRIYLRTSKQDAPVLLGGDFNAPKRETADGDIVPHGRNKGQYTNYPFYGDPYYLREPDGDVNELRFDRRWQLAESRIFDTESGEWGMRDAYWSAEASRKEASTDDFTHVVHSATPSRKRLDHVLVSEQFRVHRCELWNGVGSSIDGFDASDHAPVVATVEIG